MQKDPKLVDLADLSIDRSEKAEEGEAKHAALYGEEGEALGRFPAAWSDEIIRQVVIYANWAFARGYALGAWDKAVEIRQSLGI